MTIDEAREILEREIEEPVRRTQAAVEAMTEEEAAAWDARFLREVGEAGGFGSYFRILGSDQPLPSWIRSSFREQLEEAFVDAGLGEIEGRIERIMAEYGVGRA